jgi:phosphatidate cytidylyltransferase
LIPIVIGLIYLGGLPFLALVAIMLSLAEIEFCRLMMQGGFHPTLSFGLGLVWLFLADAQLPELGLLKSGLILILLVSLVWQMRHRQGSPVIDWALTIVGGLYLGACGASMISLGSLEDGSWWMLMTLCAIMCADTAAYFVGRTWGQHKMTPALSPGKTWEGYLAGAIASELAPVLLILLWRPPMNQARTMSGIAHSLVLGPLIGVLSPLGDLTISMIKRQVGAKDSGKIIPGHGGALDRLDTLLWAAVISYHYVLWFVV